MNAVRIRPADSPGLHAFGDEYPAFRRILLYRGEHQLVRKRVLWHPPDALLAGLTASRELEDIVESAPCS